ncbi:exopolysaccharide biosynthesis protein [Hirschia litorea]|uniref:Exopolysaccharide biosynthesis protein n=1 Tax=Hirschia litorea TaxID=1199156 RepID=A0ABW2IKH5_9PROT
MSEEQASSEVKESNHTFATLLEKIKDGTKGDKVTVRDLLDVVGRRAYGPVILLLGFISISPLTIVPGANWIFATVTWIIAIQIVFGRPYPWVPKRVLDSDFPREYLVSGLDKIEPWAKRIDKITKPRIVALSKPPFVNFVALICVAAAFLTYPLGLVPLGPLLPSLAILMIGLGLASRDGVLLIVAGVTFGGSIFLMTRLAGRILGMVGLS